MLDLLKPPPKKFVEAAEFNKKLSDEIFKTCDFGQPGRPAHSLLTGGDRTQIHLANGLELLDKVIEFYAAKGMQLDSKLLINFSSPAFKRNFLSQKLSRMSKFNPHVTPGRPIYTFWKSNGQLIKWSEEESRRRTNGRYVYVTKRSLAKQGSLWAHATIEKRVTARAKIDALQLEISKEALIALRASNCNTLEEALIAEEQAYLRSVVGE